MKNIIRFVISITIPLLVGGIAGYTTSSNIPNWYVFLRKPWFNPPSDVFGPVWTVLYILMGIGLFLIWKSPAGNARTAALRIFFVQLALNFAWSFIFFYFHQLGLALIEIILLWICIIIMIICFNRVRRIAAYLQIPYLLWVSFATCLTAAIWYLNT